MSRLSRWWRRPRAVRLPNRAEADVDRYVHDNFFPNQNHGVCVDVGAASPDFLSVSALYLLLGWTVIGIEPNPAFCEMHRRQGHDILQYACGDRDEDDVDFSIVDLHGSQYENGLVSNQSFSSLAIKDSYARLNPNLDVRKIKVKLRRLDTILAEHKPDIDHIDIVSVDVEGWELEVLAGLDLDRYQPRVLIVENLFDDVTYREQLGTRGYALWTVLAPNDVYVRK